VSKWHGGRQISYRKALEAAAQAITAGRMAQEIKAEILAEEYMREALPERQRELVEG
jgi:hypothetical protein